MDQQELKIEYPFYPRNKNGYVEPYQRPIIITLPIPFAPLDGTFVTGDEYEKTIKARAEDMRKGLNAVLTELELLLPMATNLVEPISKPREPSAPSAASTPAPAPQAPQNRQESPYPGQSHGFPPPDDQPSEKQYKYLEFLTKACANERFDYEQKRGWGMDHKYTKRDMKELLDYLTGVKNQKERK